MENKELKRRFYNQLWEKYKEGRNVVFLGPRHDRSKIQPSLSKRKKLKRIRRYVADRRQEKYKRRPKRKDAQTIYQRVNIYITSNFIRSYLLYFIIYWRNKTIYLYSYSGLLYSALYYNNANSFLLVYLFNQISFYMPNITCNMLIRSL